jgi:hypothetical protein
MKVDSLETMEPSGSRLRIEGRNTGKQLAGKL